MTADVVNVLIAVPFVAFFAWFVGWYRSHICSVVGVERCHELTGRKHSEAATD